MRSPERPRKRFLVSTLPGSHVGIEAATGAVKWRWRDVKHKENPPALCGKGNSAGVKERYHNERGNAAQGAGTVSSGPPHKYYTIV